MKPGRKLDALVAEKVMNGRLISFPVSGPFGVEDIAVKCICGEIRAVPNYSTNIEAAWEIIEKISEKLDYQIRIERHGNLRGDRVWEVNIHELSIYRIEGDTAPHAICLAALRALGIEVPDA